MKDQSDFGSGGGDGDDLAGAGADAASGPSSTSVSTTTAASRLPVLTLYPQFTHKTAPGESGALHDGHVGAAADGGFAGNGGGAAAAIAAFGACATGGVVAVVGVAIGGCAGTTSLAPHAHFALRPANSGFHLYCLPQAVQENFGSSEGMSGIRPRAVWTQ